MRGLILTDGKAGHENQSRAFVRALGGEATLLKVSFRSRLAKGLSYLLDHFGVRTPRLLVAVDADARPSPLAKAAAALGAFDVVVGTGSGTFYAAKALARRLGAKCAVVLYPRGYSLSGFDCILAPAFDRPAAAPQVVEIPANLVAADAEFYAQGVAAFKARYAPSARPAVAVIVGGPNPHSHLDAEWLRGELERIFSAHPGAEFWVTTSRRTPPAAERVVDSFPWDYRLLYSRDHFNPIPAFVALATVLYVTAESTGMLSEACTSGTARVEALDNLLPGPHKFRRFVEGLRAAGYLGGNRKVELSAEFARARSRLGL